MFNLGPGEITTMCLLALIFCGPAKLPDLAESFRTLKFARLESRWSRTDWLCALAALSAGAAALVVWGAGR